MADMLDVLGHFTCEQDEDEVQTDLNLVCDHCGTVVCTVEAGDTINLLARVCLEHDRNYCAE